ncbi:galactan 5-O-arabinofuranosyltransferase [Mycolicibacterium sp. CBMA 226]|uniref:galactan 5-O-arabinofuranosyltransferase n=1 Tax=Mycolicibacterium sp. CBMA 226 TaxID=2606611 RepID=UPI0012DD15FB|nr:galactan 5-O-arabinofuranosyltransferase [Mycolicibacterium sp. CBMA 226]MUL79913.1 arabinofuranosyltransferase [Mycolicibacterium sp. CBMA 226]
MRGALAASARVSGQMLAAMALAVIIAVIALQAIARVQWPAFNSSNQLHALTTAGQCAVLIGLLLAGWAWRRGWRKSAKLAATSLLAAFSVVTLGMPLGATKLYLFGISVDQQFRTEYLTRLADTAVPHDMTYLGLPPYYPSGWFWLGGRVAALTGTPAWEMFKPWAVVTITAAIVAAFVLWANMIRFEYALAVTTATAAVTLAYSSTEPYSAVVVVLMPPVVVLAWSGLKATGREAGGSKHSGWAAVIGTGIFLGVAALFYTLFLGYLALTFALMALLLAVSRRQLQPLIRVAVIAVISGTIAAIHWGPYLLATLHHPADKSTALHYLPMSGAQLTFPMLDATLLGVMCLVGTLWLVVKGFSSTRAAALGIAVVSVYLWSLLSMLATLARTTLLSFRLQPTLLVLLVAAGTFGFLEAARGLANRYAQPTTNRIIAVAATIGAIGAVSFSQAIPDILRPDIAVAYTDTDGYGQRADRRPPGSERFYAEIDRKITAATGKPRNETVVMTADYSFLSYYPYYGFQGLTSHYANPLAQFKERSGAIESWATMTNPDEFAKALDTLPWQAPTVFLMRHGGTGTYTLRLAEDVYPNQPNVRRYQVALDERLFDSKHWHVTDVGPFVLAIRSGH